MGHLLATTYYNTTNTAGVAVALIIFFIFAAVFYVVTALGLYGTYKKAGTYGDPAWSAFVPVYNYIVMLRVAGRPKNWAWFLLLFVLTPIPVLGFLAGIAFFVINIFVLNDISKSFGHDAAFTVGLVLVSVVFWYILWLGPSQYRGPAGPAGPGGPQHFGTDPAYPAQPGYPTQTGYVPPQPGYAPPQPGYPPVGQTPPPPAPPTYPPPPGQAPPPGQMPPPQ